jgi:prophage antirepressor-like protein
MNEIKIFNNEEFGSVRVMEIDKEPWFIGKDITTILGYTNPTKAMQDHVDKEDMSFNETLKLSRQSGAWLINESGVYSLILSSKLPSAKKFKHWVTSEVLPSVRKTGGYVNDDELFINNYLPYADENTKQLFRMNLQVIREQNIKIAQMTPKAKYFDDLVDRNLLTNFRDTAKEFNMRQKDFIQWLLDNGYVFRDAKGNLKPYCNSISDKLFQLKEYKSGDKHCGVQTLITPKGRETFRLLLNKCGKYDYSR